MARMVKTPRVRLKGFADEWVQLKFADVFFSLQNNTLSRADLNGHEGEAKSLHYGDVLIKFGEYLDVQKEKLPYITSETVAKKFKSSYLQNGDVVIADTAEDSTAGKCCEVANLQEEKVVAGLHTIPVRPVKAFAPGYLGYYMNSDFYHHQLIPLMQGIKVTSISKSSVAGTNISFPKSKEEQRYIASFLLILDEVINLHRQKIEFFSNTKKYMQEKMFPKNGAKVPEIRFAGFTKNWKQCRLGDEAAFSKGHGYSKKDITGRGTPVILYGRLYTKYQTVIDEVDTFVNAKKDSIYSKGYEVIVPSSGETAEDIARASAVGKSGILLGGDLNIVYPSEDILPAFLALVISHGDTQKLLSRRAQGKSIVHLHNSDLEDVEICFPEKHEQMKITDLFCCMDNLVSFHQRKVEGLKNIKTFFLQNMFI